MKEPGLGACVTCPDSALQCCLSSSPLNGTLECDVCSGGPLSIQQSSFSVWQVLPSTNASSFAVVSLVCKTNASRRPLSTGHHPVCPSRSLTLLGTSRAFILEPVRF